MASCILVNSNAMEPCVTNIGVGDFMALNPTLALNKIVLPCSCTQSVKLECVHCSLLSF